MLEKAEKQRPVQSKQITDSPFHQNADMRTRTNNQTKNTVPQIKSNHKKRNPSQKLINGSRITNLRVRTSSTIWSQTEIRSWVGLETLNLGQLPKATEWWSRTGGTMRVRFKIAAMTMAFLSSESWLLNPLWGAYQRNLSPSGKRFCESLLLLLHWGNLISSSWVLGRRDLGISV